MSDLKYAHAGYLYQDLLAAVDAIDLILGHATRVYCDTRLCGQHDRFDDLTVEWADGRRTRRQIKHQGNPRPVDVDTFARTKRSLHLGEVLRGIRADEAEHADRAERTSYTIYLRDSAPVDKVLTAVLTRADPDPGSSVVGSHTVRYRFDTEALWAGVQRPAAGSRKAGDAWDFLRRPEEDAGRAHDGNAAGGGNGAAREVTDLDRLVFSREELAHLTRRLIVETNAPAMSSDFAHAGPLEQLLLQRLRAEVGVGEFPNEKRRPEDVAAALVAAAANARQSHEPLTRSGLLKTLSLRTDYGSVRRRSPVVAEQQVNRQGAVKALRTSVEQAAISGGYVVVEGPPGQGKSWLADQLRFSLIADGWTVAEHYCFLNDSEEERDDRVASEKIFGSLMERVTAEHPMLAAMQRPIFSADEQTLMKLVDRVVDSGGQRVALIIDGLDHVTRVHATKPGALSASSALAAQIAALDPMAGCVIVVLGQPGTHLEPFFALGAKSIATAPLNRSETASLMARLGVAVSGLPGDLETIPDKKPMTGDGDFATVIDAVYARSAGNPLYATYLCRELKREDRAELSLTSGSMAEILAAIPPYDGDLEQYYAHLAAMLDDAGQAAADTLTLVDFPLSVEELKAIQPGQGHRVAKAVHVLEPVLRTSPRGIAIYHESFARFLRRELEADFEAMAARIAAVAAWLTELGLFRDARAFGALLNLLATAGRNKDVLDIVDRSFASEAVGAGFPPSAIRANLAVAVRCAQREGAWPAVVRCLELMKGVETYEQERLGDLDHRFLDVRLAMFGGNQVVERMLRDELTVMPAEAGVLLCAGLDRAGIVPPWRPYLRAWSEQRDERDSDPNEAVAAAWFRGQLRLLVAEGQPLQDTAGAKVSVEPHDYAAIALGDVDGTGHADQGTASAEPRPEKVESETAWEAHEPTPNDSEGEETSQSLLAQLLAKAQHWCDSKGTLSRYRIVVEAVTDTLGLDVAASLAEKGKGRGLFCLAVAETMTAVGREELIPYGVAMDWAKEATKAGIPVGHAHRLRQLGAEPTRPVGAEDGESNLVTALRTTTALLKNHSPHRAAEFLDILDWNRSRPLVLDAVMNALSGEGWYRCWLRFCVDLVRAETSPHEESSVPAMRALNRLTEDVRPFVGDPRAVDLYQEMELIWETIDRAVRLLGADGWQQGVELLIGLGAEVTRSLDGEMGVPLPPDRTLRLALDTVPDEHLGVMSDLIRAEIERSTGRFYSDIAEFYLLDALCHLRRIELAANGSKGTSATEPATENDAQDQALAAWSAASRNLLAYGWHKDITVYEVLDPLRSLNTLDAARGLERMAAAQDLVYRVRRHTDGRETRYAPTQWWQMLATADPVAHGELAAELGLDSRGSRTHFEQMRQDLWTAHAASADPLIAATLAATLPDAPQSETYADMIQGFTALELDDALEGVLQRALTRGDEIAQTSTEDNSESHSKQRNLKVINAIAAQHELRKIGLVRANGTDSRHSAEASSNEPGAEDSGTTVTTLARGDEEIAAAALEVIEGLAQSAPSGMTGAAVLIRAWRREASGVGQGATRDALIDAYAAALVDRFVTMINEGQVLEISTALESLSEVSGVSEPHTLLARIGEVLLNYGAEAEDPSNATDHSTSDGPAAPTTSDRREVAARALALAWTQARGDGGWLAFGGTNYMPLLAQATALSSENAAEAVGIGVERRLSGPGYQTMGITKALIEAFAAQALIAAGRESSTDLAFEVWDEAFAVISDRLPTLPGEQSTTIYDGVLRQPPPMEPPMNAVDHAFVVATFAGLSHPGRENLRRTLVALEDLTRLRPLQFTHALPIALRSMKGALLPLLLLSMLDDVATNNPTLLSASVDELKGLLDSKFLVVRALARRLLSLVAKADPPMATSDPAGFPTPPQMEGVQERLADAASLLWEAPFRPSVVDDNVDGFVGAILELIARHMDDDEFDSELRESVRDMGSGGNWPDALLLSDHVSEESLQEAAGALRAHFASEGALVADPVKWEDDLAELLKLTRLPLMVERGRIPRPPLPLLPKSTGQDENIPSTDEHEERAADRVIPQQSIWKPAPLSNGGPYHAWILLAYCETTRTKPPGNRRSKDLQTHVQAGVELDLSVFADRESEGPLARMDVQQWLFPSRKTVGETERRHVSLAAHAGPVGPFADDLVRLGLPSLLAPSPELVEALDLSAGSLKAPELMMSDQSGPALAHVTWRSRYSHSDYHMSYPGLTGSGLLLRPNLAAKLVERWGDRLTWRTWEKE